MLSATDSVQELFVPSPQLGEFLHVVEFSVSDGQRSQSFGDVLFRPTKLMAVYSANPNTEGGATGAFSVLNPAQWSLTRDGQNVSYLVTRIEVEGRQVVFTLAEPLQPGAYDLKDGQAPHSEGGSGGSLLFQGAEAKFVVAPVVASSPERFQHVESAKVWGIQSDLQGNYVVLYSQPTHGQGGSVEHALFAQRYNRSGEPLGLPALVTDEEVASAQIAVNYDGQFVVIWRSAAEGDSQQILARLDSADGTALGAPFAIPALGQLSEDELSVVIDPSGGFALAWSSQDQAGESQVWLQRFWDDGRPRHAAKNVGSGSQARIAGNDWGELIVAWTYNGPGGPQIWAWHYNSDGSYRGRFVQLGSRAARNLDPDVAIDDVGGFAIAWRQVQDGKSELFVQRFDSDGRRLRNAILVAEGAHIATPRVLLDVDRRLIVTWAESTWNRRAQVYGYDGAALGMPFQVSSIVATGRNGDLVTGEFRIPWEARRKSQDYLPFTIESFVTVMNEEELGLYLQVINLPRELVVDLNGEPPGIGYENNFILGGFPMPVANGLRLMIYSAGATQLAWAKVTIAGFLAGDLLETYAADTPIAASFENGVLTLSGAASIYEYMELLRRVEFSTGASRAAGTTVEISVVISDGAIESEPAVSRISMHVPGRSSIVGRHIFYNNSGFDGGDPAANPADENAVATDKTALFPGQSATFGNYTSYTRGINGIIVDLAGEHGTITADDFIFRIGNNSHQPHWDYAPLPLSVVVRSGAGANGSDRVEIIWADGAIQNIWLQVIVLDNGNTGLAQSDAFYFGNYVGDTGNEPDQVRITTTDVMRAVNHILSDPQGQSPAAIDSTIDFNRDGRITTRDVMAAVNQILKSTRPLELVWINPATWQGGITAGLTGYLTTINFDFFAGLESTQYLVAEPQAAVLQEWDPQEEEVEFRLAESTPTLLMTDPEPA